MKYITPEQYDIAAKNGIKRKTLEARVFYYGWKVERAIEQRPKRHITTKWRKIAEQNGIPASVFQERIHRLGWDYKKAATKPKEKRVRKKVQA